MSLFLFSIALVALCVFLLCFNIIFRKDGKFPDKEIGHNKELRKLGLKCAKAEEKEMRGVNGSMKKKKGLSYSPSEGCSSCVGSSCEGCC